ncbi:hypothetical protein [Desulfurobacterium sp.]
MEYTAKEVAKELGVNYTTIVWYLRVYGKVLEEQGVVRITPVGLRRRRYTILVPPEEFKRIVLELEEAKDAQN